MKNDYYEIAYNNLLYLQATLHLPYFNDIAVGSQQVAEKMLKSVAEVISIENVKLLNSHNLRGLYDSIHAQYPDVYLDRKGLSMLKDYYFDAKYPGDSFVTVTKSECEECLEIMYDVIDFVHIIRQSLDMPCRSIEKKYLSTEKS